MTAAQPDCTASRPATREGSGRPQPTHHPEIIPPSVHGTASPRRVTMTCPTCGQPFEPTGRRRYCSDACRAAAYRRRRDATQPALAVPKA